MDKEKTEVVSITYAVRRLSDKFYLNGSLQFVENRSGADEHPSPLCARQRQQMIKTPTDIVVIIEQVYPHG